MTKDKLAVLIEYSINYKCIDEIKYLFATKTRDDSIQAIIESKIRSDVGRMDLSELLENKDIIASHIYNDLSAVGEKWGVEIINTFIREIIIPNDIKIALASETTAKSKGRAIVTISEANVEAAKKSREVADLLAHNGGMQIRYLQMLENISATGMNKLILLPGDIKYESIYPLMQLSETTDKKDSKPPKLDDPKNNETTSITPELIKQVKK